MPNEVKKDETLKERRILGATDIELRVTDDDQPKLVGYAAKFGNFTDLGWFREKIRAGAFDEAIKDSDVRCLKNHNADLILGRTKNQTLRLETNSVGLRFVNDMPNTTTGKDTLEEVRRGDISGCSFAFTVSEDIWKHYDDDRPAERTITKIGQLFDVGPVTYPAYPDTTVAARSLPDTTIAARSLDKFKEDNKIEKPEETEERKTEQELKQEKELDIERQRDYARKYRKAGRILNRLRDKNDL